MKKQIAVLGSTGSIGVSTLKSISKSKEFAIILLTTKKNINKIYKQAISYKVKNVIIEDKKQYEKFKDIFKKKKINLFLGSSNIVKIFKGKKISYCVNAISGIDGLQPSLMIIPFVKKFLTANKESIMCGWELISKTLKKNKTEFIPIDSEHFSIWKLIKSENRNNINRVILTASGGPFLRKSKKTIINIKPKFALKHPNWRMGKKISIDSSTMMNKIFEYIEAKKIFNLKKKQISILIHPTSFVHAIVYIKGDIIKFLAHDADMKIPISNALDIYTNLKNSKFISNMSSLNNCSFEIPDIKQFPLLTVLNLVPEKSSYFETILITINDSLVDMYLNNNINYISIHKNLLRLIKSPFFSKYYKLKPKNIYDIKKMILITKKYLNLNIKHYDN